MLKYLFYKEKCIQILARGTIQTVVLGDFNYPKIDWTHCATTTNTNDPNLMFLETIRDCFL